MVVVAVLSLVEYDSLLHVLILEFEFPLLEQVENLCVASYLADVFPAAVLNNEVVVVVALPEGRKLQLFHLHEVLVAEAELVLASGVELVEVGEEPAVLVVGGVELDLLAADVELVAVVEGDEVDGHDLVAVAEEHRVYQTGPLVLADSLLPVPYLERPDLKNTHSTSFLFFFRFTMNSLTESVAVSFSPCRMATVFLLQIMRIWSERS